jgi:phage terminase large subunit-like protein
MICEYCGAYLWEGIEEKHGEDKCYNSYAARSLRFCYDAIEDKLEYRKASKREKLAYQRHLLDLEKSKSEDFPYYFDAAAGNKHCKFMEKLPHTKGSWRGSLLVLSEWQVFLHATLFGWKKKSNGLRRFNKVFWMLPRKQGKSLAAAGIGLYMAFVDEEPGAEVYACAQTEKQAMCVFEPAFAMCKINPDLVEAFGLTLSGTNRNPTSIYKIADMSRFEPVVGRASDGQSPHAALVDEYHEAQTSALYDSMSTGMGARRSPLLCVISTAGVDLSSPCYDMFLNCVKVLDGELEQEDTFIMIFGIDPEMKYEDYESWKTANPNLGISINEDYLYGKYQDAMKDVSQRSILLTKHLNLWQASGVTAFDMIKFKANARPEMKLEDFKDKKCVVSLDLASKIDILAMEIMFELEDAQYKECPRCGEVVLFKNEIYICSKNTEEGSCSWQRKSNKRTVVFSKFYLPEETVLKKENQAYRTWAAKGLLTVTEGSRTDLQKVEEDLEKLNEDFIISELVFDPKDASYFVQNIQKWAGFECIEFTQSPSLISEPFKECEAMIVDGCFLHDGNEVLTWMFGNTIKKQGKSGGSVKHYFPTKQTEGNKIDGTVACLMALARIMTYEDNGDSYNSRAAKGEENILRVI